MHCGIGTFFQYQTNLSNPTAWIVKQKDQLVSDEHALEYNICFETVGTEITV